MSESAAPRPLPPLPTSPPVPARGFLVAVLTGLALSALADLFSLFAGLRYRTVVDGDAWFRTATAEEVESVASLYDTAARYQAIVYLPCAIVFVVWFFRMRRATGALAPDRFRSGPGWAVGAWLIPLANLWLPYRVAFDMWGATTVLPYDGGPPRTRLWPLNLWWGLFVAGTLFGRVAGSDAEDAGTLSEVRDGVARYMMADALHILAAAAAAYFAVQLTARQRYKAVHGPYGAPAPSS
ncbi:DUF4328 domain-containing protein [Streptomyces sp. NPDC023723]|uniref:DUF4328 domain-containing protein n=1 Tax=Streptomyces sp. NPDC023723 TaxID=3154323 RepID=UPI0033E73684